MKLLIGFASLFHGVFPTDSIAHRTRSKRALDFDTTADVAKVANKKSKTIAVDGPEGEALFPFVSFANTGKFKHHRRAMKTAAAGKARADARAEANREARLKKEGKWKGK